MASFIAALLPQHVKSLLSIEALGLAESKPKYVLRQFHESYESLKTLSKKEPKEYASREDAARARMKGIDKLSQKITFEACLELVERCCGPHPNGKPGVLAFSHDILLRQPSVIYLTKSVALEILKNIKCPMEVILGNQGQNHPLWKERIEFMQAQNAQFKAHHMEGYHHLHLETPKPIVDIAVELLKKTRNRHSKL